MSSKPSKKWLVEYAESAYEEISALDASVKKLIKKGKQLILEHKL